MKYKRTGFLTTASKLPLGWFSWKLPALHYLLIQLLLISIKECVVIEYRRSKSGREGWCLLFQRYRIRENSNRGQLIGTDLTCINEFRKFSN